MSLLTGAFLGLVIGLRHAFEPDHLAAVSTLVSETGDAKRGAFLGAMWGIGHTAALFVVAMILSLVGGALSPALANGFELVVAIMLVVLGTRAVYRAARLGQRGTATPHVHRHGTHTHPTSAPHVHLGRAAFAWRPLLVGTLHGLAGSGALIVFVAAKMPTTLSRLLYILIFGVGSMAGMAIVSAIGGAALGNAGARWQRRLQLTMGVVSVAVGVWWGWPLVSDLVA